jgi:hypothetical protein
MQIEEIEQAEIIARLALKNVLQMVKPFIGRKDCSKKLSVTQGASIVFLKVFNKCLSQIESYSKFTRQLVDLEITVETSIHIKKY